MDNSNSLDTIRDYLNQLSACPVKEAFDISMLTGKYALLGQALLTLQKKLNEVYDFSIGLASGNIDNNADKDNFYAGPLKDLQASLRHLTWQAICVAEGDYDQKIDFLGEFSEAFNVMTFQLKARETLAKEKARAEKEMTDNKVTVLKTSIQQQLDYYQRLNETGKQIRSCQHDIKNHLLSLDSLLSQNKSPEAREYLAAVSTQIFSDELTVHTDNYLFDVLVSEKLRTAENAGIRVDKNIRIYRKLNIENIDWCILMGNVLDNAIEACIKYPQDAFISLNACDHGNMLSLLIKNSAPKAPKPKGAYYASSKEDAKNHGAGLKNVAKIVDKYNGVLDLSHKDGIFTISCLLCQV